MRRSAAKELNRAQTLQIVPQKFAQTVPDTFREPNGATRTYLHYSHSREMTNFLRVQDAINQIVSTPCCCDVSRRKVKCNSNRTCRSRPDRDHYPRTSDPCPPTTHRYWAEWTRVKLYITHFVANKQHATDRGLPLEKAPRNIYATHIIVIAFRIFKYGMNCISLPRVAQEDGV